MPTELFSNDAQTTLAAAAGTADTTISVTSSAGFPAAASGVSRFRVRVGDEYMIVTNVSTTTWTVTRGTEGSAAAAHAAGAAVTHVVTAESLTLVDHAVRHTPGGPDPIYAHFGHNLLGIETFPRYSANTNNAGNNNAISGMLVTPEQDATVTQLTFVSGGAAAGATGVRFGLWEEVSATDLRLLAETDNDTTIFGAANTIYTRALSAARGGPTSLTMLRGKRYAITYLLVGATTNPGIRSASGLAALNAVSPRSTCFLGSRSDHPPIGGVLTLNNSGINWWGYAS